MSQQDNEVLQKSISKRIEQRKSEMRAIHLFIQMNLVELCQEKMAFDDASELPENAKILVVSDRLSKIVTPSKALTLALRMIAEEAAREIACR